jgi:NADH dehydrogenase
LRVAVTGASGFIGSNLWRSLIADGHEVVGVSRGERKRLPRNGMTWVSGDVATGSGLEKAFEDSDAVVHLTAIRREKGKQKFETVNVKGAANVARAASSAGIKHLIYIGGLGAEPDPSFPFLASKWAGEQAVIASGVPYTSIRASLVFGIGGDAFTTFAKLIKRNPVAPIPGSGTTTYQPIAVGDLIKCIEVSLQRGPGNHSYDVGGPEHLTLEEIFDVTKSALAVRRRNVHVPLPLLLAASYAMSVLPNPPVTPGEVAMLQRNNITSLDAVPRAFGFQPISFRQGCDYLADY